MKAHNTKFNEMLAQQLSEQDDLRAKLQAAEACAVAAESQTAKAGVEAEERRMQELRAASERARAAAETREAEWEQQRRALTA